MNEIIKQTEDAIYLKATPDHVIIIDKEDYDLIKDHTWCAWDNHGRGWYAVSYRKEVFKKRTVVKMHRFLLGLSDPKYYLTHVDHVNHNTLDNRKSNLRKVTPGGNSNNHKFINGKTNEFLQALIEIHQELQARHNPIADKLASALREVLKPTTYYYKTLDGDKT